MGSLTQNQNHLSPNGFTLRVANPEFQNTSYTVVSASLPGINLNEVGVGFKNHQAYEPGDKLQYDPISIRMLINEDMENYLEIFNWLLTNQTARLALRADIVLTILTSHKNPNWEVTFHDAFPTSLSGLDFSTQNPDVEYLTSEVTFRYNRASFRRVA